MPRRRFANASDKTAEPTESVLLRDSKRVPRRKAEPRQVLLGKVFLAGGKRDSGEKI